MHLVKATDGEPTEKPQSKLTVRASTDRSRWRGIARPRANGAMVKCWLRPQRAYLGSGEHYLDRHYSPVSIDVCPLSTPLAIGMPRWGLNAAAYGHIGYTLRRNDGNWSIPDFTFQLRDQRKIVLRLRELHPRAMFAEATGAVLTRRMAAREISKGRRSIGMSRGTTLTIFQVPSFFWRAEARMRTPWMLNCLVKWDRLIGADPRHRKLR